MAFLTSGIRPYIALVLLALALYLPGLAALPPFDRDEARFAQATRQMLEDGDFIRIRFQTEPRHKKPAGIHWLQAASVAAFSTPGSDAVWPYRVPSMLGMIAAVLLTFGIGQRLFDRRAALAGAALLGCSIAAVTEAHLAKTDAVLLATVVAAQAALARIYLESRQGRDAGLATALGFWAALGVGLLIKGPIAPMVALLTLAALWMTDPAARLLRPLRPLVGVPLAAAIFAPWLIAMMGATGGAFVEEAVGQDLLPKLLGGQESHGFPPGYYLLLLTLTFWPGSIFVWHALVWGWEHRREPAIRFCLAWIVPSWIVFESVPTKLPHYTLPLYPALALMTGAAVVAASDGLLTRLQRWDSRLAFLAWGLVTLGIGLAVFALPLGMMHRVEPASLLPLVAALFGAGFALRAAWRQRIGVATALAMATAVLVLVPTFRSVLPAVEPLWLSRSAHELVSAAASAGPPRPVAAIGYQEPSLVFLLGTDTRLIGASESADFLGAHPDGLLLVASSAEREVRQVLRAAGLGVRPLGFAQGFNYSKGQWLDLTLLARQEGAPAQRIWPGTGGGSRHAGAHE